MRHLHFNSALRSEVGFEDIMQTLGGIDVHVKCCRLVQHLRIRIQHPQRHCIAVFPISAITEHDQMSVFHTK